MKEITRKTTLPTGFCDSHHFIKHPPKAKNLPFITQQHPTDLKFPFKQSCGYADSKDSTWILLPPIPRQMQQKNPTPAYLRQHVFDCIFTGNGVKGYNNVRGTYWSQLEWVLIWEALKGSCRTQRRLLACICSAHQPLSSKGKEKVSPASQNTFQLFVSPQCL